MILQRSVKVEAGDEPMSLLAFLRMVRTWDIQGGEPVSVDEVVANGEKVLGSTRVIRKFALGGAG